METIQFSKTAMLYKNALAGEQPEFTDAKLNDDIEMLSRLEKCFAEVEGQGYACHAVKEQLFGMLHRTNKSGPAAIFFFAGPPASGKTFLAQKIGEALGMPFERFDMSGYSDKEAPISLFGLNRSYKSAAPGRFTTYIKEHPVSIILFDGIEKAHVTVRNNMLQMLDKGAVRDLFYERDFSVRDCILIFTSNVGTDAYDTGDPYNLSAVPMMTVISALENEKDPSTNECYFSREMVSRFASGRIIVFNRLRPEILHRIAVKHIAEHREYYHREYNIDWTMDNNALAELILFSQGGNADIRSVIRAVKDFFTGNFERAVELVSGKRCGGRICRVCCNIDMSDISKEAEKVMLDAEPLRIFVFGADEYGFLQGAQSGVEAIASSVTALSEINALAPQAAVLGITDKNELAVKKIFDDLVAVGVPVYVCAKDKNISLRYYEENGAVSCCLFVTETAREAWKESILRGIRLNKAAKKLFRANKVVSFSTSYQYSPRDCRVDLTLSRFITQIAYECGESVIFTGKAAIPDVGFDDIIGAEEAKRELEPIMRQLKDYEVYKKKGIRIPRGIILDGPPGSGKTMLAKAVANAAGLPFISMNATEFLSKWVGEGERNIRKIFATARRYAPSVIFIDEIDCIAKDRLGNAAWRSHTEGLTNIFLSELDGFDSANAAPVFMIAATNFDTHGQDSKLDKAFLRRFDKKVHISLPKSSEREQFILRELSRYDFSEVSKNTVQSIAERSVGWSLSDLNLVIQNAVRHSETNGQFLLTDKIFEEAFGGFNDGERKPWDSQMKQKTAYHEAGHAVSAALMGLKLAYVTIVSRSGYGGYIQYSDENKFDFSRKECLDRICTDMAGRAAEVCFYGDDGITTGASEDIRSATESAMRMVGVYGMEEDMLCCLGKEKIAENGEVLKRVQNLLAEQYKRAVKLICDNRRKVEAVAKALVERESLTEKEILHIIC